MRRTIYFYLVLSVAVLALNACDNSRKQILGKWKTQSGDVVWEFSGNGNFSNGSTTGRYRFGDNNRLKIQTTAATFVYQLEYQGDRMIWKDPNGSKMELIKIK